MSHITATLERCTAVICIFQVSVCGRIRESYELHPSQTAFICSDHTGEVL